MREEYKGLRSGQSPQTQRNFFCGSKRGDTEKGTEIRNEADQQDQEGTIC